ncbi:hypothetical protein LCGC14_1690130 [marine sediment metagenome]|uniref:Uncharacterized protein n=1 Tax=marine sediment metagenome TaxID=412755 RepID=A0A0F9I8Q3_9ZZZZ
MINGNITAILAYLKLPTIAVASAGGLMLIATAFGFSVTSPGAAMEDFKVDHNVTHEVIDTALLDIGQHMEVQQSLLEGLTRSECIRETKENLERAGMIQACDDLGIAR